MENEELEMAKARALSLENLEKAHENQLKSLHAQYAARFQALEQERDARIRGLERMFESQKISMKMNKRPSSQGESATPQTSPSTLLAFKGTKQ